MSKKLSLRQQQVLRPATPSRWTRTRKIFSGLVGGAVALVGLLAVLWPRPTVVQTDPVDPSNILSASFVVRNAGFVPLEHVGVAIALGQIDYDTPPASVEPNSYDSPIGIDTWQEKSLSMDQSATITIADLFSRGEGIAYFDVAILVRYKWWFVPVTLKKKFKFVTKRQTNGNLYWYAQPI